LENGSCPLDRLADIPWGKVHWFAQIDRSGRAKQKADVTEHPEVPSHAGLLTDGSPDKAGLPFI
jgi:hypothetical protein